MSVAIILPALNPDKRLVELVKRLCELLPESPIVVVDDGSAEKCRAIFDRLRIQYGCIICRHASNLGKGAAIKTGIRFAAATFPEVSGFVTADADGQHLPKDIAAVAFALEEADSGSIIIGTRDFSSKYVPFRSRWGNRITRMVFWLVTGVRFPDTQSGLRGIPASMAGFCLSVPGERFEYEMNVLTAAARSGIRLSALPISTVYFEGNSSSHFRPLADSIRIYCGILRFAVSSAACAVADLAIFTLLSYLAFGRSAAGILWSTVIARCVAGALNFALNKNWCFASRGEGLKKAAKYAALFIFQMFASWSLVTLLSGLSVNLTLLKALVDSSLFFFSYFVQKNFIFNGRAAVARAADSGGKNLDDRVFS